MKWNDFTLKAMQKKRPNLEQSEYHRVVDGVQGTVGTKRRLDQYTLLGTELLKIHLFEILEWRLGLHHLAVVELSDVIGRNLAQRFGELLEPITSAVEMGLDVEQLGKRMLGFMYAKYSRTVTDHVLNELCKQMVLPHQISIDTALKINHHPAVDILRIDGQAFGQAKYRYQIPNVGADNIIGVNRDQVESQFLMTEFGKDIRQLRCIPRYRRHHAPERWAVWLFPNDFANYWQLPNQDVMDLMDDTDENRRDRHILRRIGEQVLRAEYLRCLILNSQLQLKYDELTSVLARKLVMPDHIQYPEDREHFLRQFVGYWRVNKHETLPEVISELTTHTHIHHQTPLGSWSNSSKNQVAARALPQKIEPRQTQVRIDQLAENFQRVTIGEYPSEIKVDVDETFPKILTSLMCLGEIKRIEWIGRAAQPEDIYAIIDVLHRAKVDAHADIHLAGPFIPKASKLRKPHKKKFARTYSTLLDSGVALEHTITYEKMKSFLRFDYQYQTIIIRSTTDAELSFAQRSRAHHPEVMITCCTYAHPLAQQIFKQKREFQRQARIREQSSEFNQVAAGTNVISGKNQNSKVQRLGRPAMMTAKDLFKQRLSEISDVQIKNRLQEWMKYKPDTIQQNISVVKQPYFALYFKSRNIVILDSFEPKNAYFVFYNKSLQEVVSRVRHLGSKQAVLNYSTMQKRGYHDTEPIELRARRIFMRQV